MTTGDSAIGGTGERACPMCRASGALCAFHQQMFSEPASATPNMIGEAIAQSDYLERSQYLYAWRKRHAAGAARSSCVIGLSEGTGEDS